MGINRITQLRKNLPVIRPNTNFVPLLEPRAAPTNFVPQTTVMHYESTYYPKIEAKNLVIHGKSTFKDNLNLEGNLTVDGSTELNSETSINANVNVNGVVDCSDLLVNSMVLVPTGTVVSFIKTSAPSGWLICDGTAYSRTFYNKLFSVIGTTFGGDVGTFNVPDLRGRTIIGIGTGVGLTTRNLGDTGGEESHTLTLSEIPSHSHTGNTSTVSSHTHTGTTDSAGSHSHTYNDAYFAENGGNQIGGNSVFGTNSETDADNEFRWRTANGSWSYSPEDLNTSTASAHTHTFTTGSAGGHSHTITAEGGNGTHNNMQPYITLSYIIKY